MSFCLTNIRVNLITIPIKAIDDISHECCRSHIIQRKIITIFICTQVSLMMMIHCLNISGKSLFFIKDALPTYSNIKHLWFSFSLFCSFVFQ